MVVRGILDQHIDEVHACYAQELASSPKLQGHVAGKFIVSPTGAVQTAAVADSTFDNPKVAGCIVNAVRRLQFPSPPDGGIVVVTYPLVLEQLDG